MINTSVVVEDDQVLRLILEFLDSRKLHNTMRSLEKESGIVNCGYSDDILFLRDLVLDGEWEAILIFAQPFEGITDFDSRQFRYLVLKQKFMEVLYFKSGFAGNSTSYSIEDLIKCLNQLEEDCPNKAEYSKLCFLLTVPNLPEQPEYRDWNPATARIKCFEQILDLLRKVIPIEKKGLNGKLPRTLTPIKDRLLHLVIKGLCFESCVDYCQLRAINGNLSEDLHVCIGDNILNGPSQESSGNFLSWLKNLSQDAFITPFEPVSLEVDLKRVKQASGVLFHKSPRRDDAEILSRSLSLSGRPATADIASHLSALETGRNNAAIFNDRPHSTEPLKGVSQSYNEFHYKGYPEKEPITYAVNNGLGENRSATKLENDGQREMQTFVPDSNSHDVVQEHEPSQPSAGNHAAEPSKDVDGVHALKEQQQQNVLKQLEAYERQKQELERQLLELSLRETVSGRPNAEGEAASELPDKRPMSGESIKSFRNEHLANSADFQRPSDSSLQQAQTIQNQNEEILFHNHNQEIVYPVQNEDHVSQSHDSFRTQQSAKPHPKNEKQDSYSFSVNHAMTSTPAVKTKHKPEDLNLEEAQVDNTAQYVIPVTPAEQMFPLTPLANGLAPSSVGHWVALADGSGVLNTSTPKCTRHGLSSTPAPPASPVLSVDGATPHGIALVYEKDKPKVVTKYNDADDQSWPLVTADSGKDKENTVSQNQQGPVKRGPKVNGVRRSLVPQAGTKQKMGVIEENKNMRIPAQGLNSNAPTVGKIKSLTGSNNSPTTPQMQSQNQQMGQAQQVHDGARVNGQPPRSGTTFVVHPSAESKPQTNRTPSNEHNPEVAKQPYTKELNSDTQKGKEPGTVNMTFRKPSTNTPPNNTTVVVNQGSHGNHVSLLEKQKELLHSSSDITFYTVATLEDVQAIRAIAFHPSGELFAVGSNSKTLRVCTAEGLNSQRRMESNSSNQPPQPTILFKSNRHHRGSIYCVAWSAGGDIIATGSNDKSIKMTRFDAETCSVTWPGLELAIHNGTVRDLAFVSRASGTPVLVSGGAGDGNIMISDCSTGQTVGQLKGHAGHIMAVYADSDDIIASGSSDNTVRLWDLRSQRCIDAIATGDSCVASVCVNTSGNMLASGHEDGSCMIYDITAGRTLQLFKPHTMDCRSVRFSPDNNFLLTGSYDTSIIMMDVRKDLETRIPPYSVVAHHRDKVIQCRWHPSLLAFLSSSADRTVSLWAPDC